MKKFTIVFILLALLTCVSGCGALYIAGYNSVRIPDAIMREKNIQVYGEVVDQYGNGVPDAKVKLTAENFALFSFTASKYSDHERTTDENGRFRFGKRGSSVRIREITKPGYQPLNHCNLNNGHNYYSIATSKKKPAEFRLRKKKLPAYLINNEGNNKQIKFDWTERKFGGFDLLWKWYDENGFVRNESKDRSINSVRQERIGYFGLTEKFEKAMKEPQVMKPMRSDFWSKYSDDLNVIMRSDILVTGTPVDGDDGYRITFMTLEEEAGIIISEKLLYEAPINGYKSEVSIKMNKPDSAMKDSVKYLYVKGQKGSYFSRVEIIIMKDSDDVRLLFNRTTNPAGSRNLEYDPEYQSQERGRRQRIGGKREEAKFEIYKKRIAAKKECRRKSIKFDKEKFERENKFDEGKFMEKIRAEEAEAKKNKPLKWWDKLTMESVKGVNGVKVNEW